MNKKESKIEEILRKFEKEFPRQSASPKELEDWLWAEKQDIKSFIRQKLEEQRIAILDEIRGKEEDIKDLLGTMTSYYFKGGNYEDQDLYCEDIAEKIIDLLNHLK